MDPESLRSSSEEGDRSKPRFARVGKLVLPFRRQHVVADAFKFLACIMTAVSILELVWLLKLRDGYMRIENDPFDNLFNKDITRSSPAIWDDNRQAFIHNARPVPVHSHNDYWRRIPLFEALGSGCTSVEADVHLTKDDLLVGHSATGLHSDSSLRSIYLDPLQQMINEQNTRTLKSDSQWRGIFNQQPQQTVVLLVDIKTSGEETFAELDRQLQPLRDLDYLTFWNGTQRVTRPLTIVASGNTPFHSVLALNETHRDIFFDAPLEQLPRRDDNFTNPNAPIYKYNQSNSYYASTRFRNANLWAWHPPDQPLPTTPQGKDIEATDIEQANARGLVSRYWDTPSSPKNLKDVVWRVLVDVKVGVINMDDMGVVREKTIGWGDVKDLR